MASTPMPTGAAGPAAPMPSLVTTSILVTAIVLPILATLAVFLRFCLRWNKSKSFGADDWTVAAAMVINWGLSGVTFSMTSSGVDYITDTPKEAVQVFVRGLWIAWFFLVVVLGLIKISALLFFASVFSTPKFRLATWIMIGIITLFTLLAFFISLFASTPINAVYTDLSPHFNIDDPDFLLSISGINIGLDIVVLLFPLPVIKSLQMRTSRKIQVAAIFLIGSFCVVASALRFHFSLVGDKVAPASHANNKFLYAIPSLLWTHIEPSVSIITICLPTYGVPFGKLYGKTIGSVIIYMRSAFSIRSTTSASDRGEASLTTPHDTDRDSVSVAKHSQTYELSQDLERLSSSSGHHH